MVLYADVPCPAGLHDLLLRLADRRALACSAPKHLQPRGTETSRLRLGRQTHGVLCEVRTRSCVISHGKPAATASSSGCVRSGHRHPMTAPTSRPRLKQVPLPNTSRKHPTPRTTTRMTAKTRPVPTSRPTPCPPKRRSPSPVGISRTEFYVATSWIARTRVARPVSESRARAASR